MTNPPRDLVTARDIDRLARGATLRVSPRAIITPWARDRAAIRGVTITTCDSAPEETSTPAAAPAPTCGCSTPVAEPTPPKPAGKPAPAWVSPFENRIIRGPNVSVLLGGSALPAKGGY